LLATEVYIHQTKINTKRAMAGDWWEWHQDFAYWHQDDGMPSPEVLTAMVYLNDVNEFNGPMLVIPGSHKAGMINDKQDQQRSDENSSDWFNKYQNSTTYMSALTTNLKYKLNQSTLINWVEKKGIYSAIGPAGSVLFFHGNVFHASSNNLSPWDRNAFLITYNSINNTLRESENRRPEFIANRNFTPVKPIENDYLGETKSF
jgi:ectoine hydroxylase